MCITPFTYAYSLCEIFVIVIVYVKYLNFVGTPKEFTRIVYYLKNECEMKDLGKQKNFLDQVLFKRNISLLVNIYKESLEALSYW